MAIDLNSNKSLTVIIVFVVCFCGLLLIFGHKKDPSADISTESTIKIQEPSSSSTLANCVVCGKQCDYYHENMYMGHHVKIGGQMSSDVVCGLECDVKLRKRNERILDRESHTNY